jgi:hypothetical protein
MRIQPKNKHTTLLTAADDSTSEFATLEIINKRFDTIQTNLNKFENSIKKIKGDYVLNARESPSHTKINGPRVSVRANTMDINEIMSNTNLRKKYKVQGITSKTHSNDNITHPNKTKKSQPIFVSPIIKKARLVLYKINRFGSLTKIT